MPLQHFGGPAFVAQRLRTHGQHLDDTHGLSVQQVRAKCARLHAQHPLGLVLVDYVQLMRGDQKGNREQEVGSTNSGLKELAKELNVLVIALSQLSRDVEKRGVGRSAPFLRLARVLQPVARCGLHRVYVARRIL